MAAGVAEAAAERAIHIGIRKNCEYTHSFSFLLTVVPSFSRFLHPHRVKYIEQELAKRRGHAEEESNEPRDGEQPSAEVALYTIPEHLKVRGRDGWLSE